MGEGSGVAVSCGVGCRRGLDPTLLWLWPRLVATAPIQPLAWEPPYVVGVAQEMAERQKKKKKNAHPSWSCYGKSLSVLTTPTEIWIPRALTNLPPMWFTSL